MTPKEKSDLKIIALNFANQFKISGKDAYSDIKSFDEIKPDADKIFEWLIAQRSQLNMDKSPVTYIVRFTEENGIWSASFEKIA